MNAIDRPHLLGPEAEAPTLQGLPESERTLLIVDDDAPLCQRLARARRDAASLSWPRKCGCSPTSHSTHISLIPNESMTHRPTLSRNPRMFQCQLEFSANIRPRT